MKFGPWELRRFIAAAAITKRTPEELGASGTINLKGYLQQAEYNAELRGPLALQVFDRMRRSDASVQEAIQHIFAPIKNAAWMIEPADPEDPQALEQAAFIRHTYEEWCVTPWLESLNEQLKYLVFGHYVFETVMQIVDEEIEYDGLDGERVVVPRRQYITLRRLAPRLPRTIIRWLMENGEFAGIEQQAMSNTGEFLRIVIPADRLLVLTNDREGDDFTGISMIRPAYKPWVMKELIEKVAAVAIERHGAGVPVVYLPQMRADDADTLSRVEEMLKNLRAGEFTYMVFPGPKAQGGQDGYTFEIAGPQGSPPDFAAMLTYHRAEIKAAVLARFAELGHAQTGARSTGDTQSQVWYDALHAVARYIADAHQPLIKRLVDMNYANVSAYPKLVATDIETRNLQEFSVAVSGLVGAGAVLPDPKLRAWVREVLNAPEEAEPQEILDDQEARTPDDILNPPVEQDTQPGDKPPPKPPPGGENG